MKHKKIIFYSIGFLFIAVGVFYTIYSASNRSMDSETIATVNGNPLKLQDFQERLSAAKINIPPDQKQDIKKIKASILRKMIIEALILQEAENKKISISEEELERYIKTIRQNYTNADFNQMLNNQFKTYEDWMFDVKKKLLIEKTLSKEVTEKLDISDKEIQEYYDKNYAGKNLEPKLKLAQIFTTTKAAAEQAMAELNNGQSFEVVAKKLSQTPEAVNGGVIGYIKKGDGIQIFDKAFDMKPSEISGILQSEYGFHILKVLDHIPAYQPVLDNVKQSIINTLASQKESRLYEKWLSDNLKSAKILKNTALLDSVK